MNTDLHGQQQVCMTNHGSSTNRFTAGCMLLVLLLGTGNAAAQAETEIYRLALDNIKAGQLPTGWVTSATNPDGPLALWEAEVDSADPKHGKVLSVLQIRDTSSSVFNLNWTKQVSFLNIDMSVHMRANSGKEDQGGGMIWRGTDENNYYVARYNPLEGNFRLYYVEGGMRNTLASAEHFNTAKREWIQLRVRHQGQRIQGWLNNSLAWEINDTHFSNPGGIGLWTKADAASSFTNLVISGTPAKDSGRQGDE